MPFSDFLTVDYPIDIELEAVNPNKNDRKYFGLSPKFRGQNFGSADCQQKIWVCPALRKNRMGSTRAIEAWDSILSCLYPGFGVWILVLGGEYLNTNA